MSQSLQHLEHIGTSLLVAFKESSLPSRPKLDKRPSPESAQELHEVQRRDPNDPDIGVFESPLLHEDLCSFVEAAQLIPISTRPHAATISRWCSSGVRGIKLESVRIASRRATSKQAVARFLEACRKQDFAGLSAATAAELERALAAQEAVESYNKDAAKSSSRSQSSRPSKRSRRRGT